MLDDPSEMRAPVEHVDPYSFIDTVVTYRYEARWDCRNDAGYLVVSGLYFARMDGEEDVVKIAVIR